MNGDSKEKIANYQMRVGKLGNRLKTPFEIQVVEHLYDGSPRWREEDAGNAYRAHTGDRTSPDAREPEVRWAIDNAWGRESPGQSGPSGQERFGQGLYDLLTCTNPGCEERTQLVVRGGTHLHRGEAPCSECGKPLSLLHCQPLEKKWLYVLSGDGMRLSHEIYARDEYEWLVLRNPDPARGRLPVFEGSEREKRIAVTRARLAVTAGESYRFFVSPVQLGKRALDELISAARSGPSSKPRANNADGYNEQLETTLLERRFHAPPVLVGGKPSSRPELVGVVDPFAYTLEAKEWDLLPIAEALYRLQLDNGERAKKNIASVLSALIGEGSGDKLDLADEMYRYASNIEASHNAEAWLNKHKACLEFLARELDAATARLIEWLDCRANWVVELAIQERKSDPKILMLGFAYYSLILKEIMASPIGQAYVVRLSKKDTERIPYRFAVDPDEEAQAAIKAMRAVAGDLAVQLYTLMLPALIAQTDSSAAADAFAKGLNKLGVEALVTGDIHAAPAFGYKGIMLVKNTLLAIDEKRVERELRPLIPERIRARVAPALKLFSQFESHIEALFSLYMGLKVYTEKPKKNESSMDRFVREKGQWEYPFKAVKFINDLKKLQMALWAKKEFGIDLAKYAAGKADYLIEGSSPALKSSLLDREAMRLLERNAQFYRDATRLTKFLSGPVALVFGGMDLVIQARETINSWEDGNSGGATGSVLLWSAAAIGVSAAVVESMALIGVVSAVTAEALLGPLGIVAALVTVSAMLVFWLFSKSDLELYASHCFLGDEWGEGSGSQGPNWAEGKSYPSWPRLPDSAVKQNHYLINLISSVKVLMRHLPLLGAKAVRYGCFVQTGWLPPGARCEVVVIGTYDDTGKPPGQQRTEVESTAYVDLDTGEYLVKRDPRYPAPWVSINAFPHNSWGTKRFRYFTVSLEHTGGKLKAPTMLDKYGRLLETYHCHVKVRVDVDGAGHYMPNGFDGTKYLELKNTEGFAGELLKKWPS